MRTVIGIPPAVNRLGGIFSRYGIDCYMVGGYVRNALLGLPVSGTDIDVCSRALPDEAAGLLRENGIRVIEKAPAFGTIEIHTEDGGQRCVLEHTTFRKDFYGMGGVHRPARVSFTDDVNLDAQRRDFTVNALYADVASGRVMDVLGRSLSDLNARRIAAAHQDAHVTLQDDGLRLLRMVRFACELGFDIDRVLSETALVFGGLLRDISGERIRAELVKILLSDAKYGADPAAHRRGMLLLDGLGLLPYVLPCLLDCKNVCQNHKFHAYDVFTHSIETLASSSPDLCVRLAALLHDTGKPQSLRTQGNMYAHPSCGASLARRDLKRLAFDKKTVDTVSLLIENHMFDLDNRAKEAAVRKRVALLGVDAFQKLIALRRADFIGSGKPLRNVESADKWQVILDRMIAQHTPLSENDLDISGGDIMQALHLKPGKAVGEIKKALLNICMRNPSQNNRLKLLVHAKRLYRVRAENHSGPALK